VSLLWVLLVQIDVILIVVWLSAIDLSVVIMCHYPEDLLYSVSLILSVFMLSVFESTVVVPSVLLFRVIMLLGWVLFG
jgi:hypothetical protein